MSLPPAYFERLYAGDDDPWGFGDRWYEQRKRAVTLAALTCPRYGSAFEVGCSIGLLTQALAGRCDQVLAVDVSTRALELATGRVADAGNVVLERRAVPDDWPSGRRFDLVVLSEVGYYLDAAELVRLADLAVRSLTPDGELLLCHWRHEVADYPLLGDEVHEQLRSRTDLEVAVSHVEPDFRLDVLVAAGRDASVARATGVR